MFCKGRLGARARQRTRFCSISCAGHHRYGVFSIKTLANYYHADASTGCWNWTRATDGNGRGNISFGGKNHIAYRLVYELLRGPIPDGVLACHTCDNPRCINPAHIFLGTAGDNMQDAVKKGRTLHGERHHHARATDDIVRQIRDRYAGGGVSMYRLSIDFGLSTSTISRIVKRKGWKHVV